MREWTRREIDENYSKSSDVKFIIKSEIKEGIMKGNEVALIEARKSVKEKCGHIIYGIIGKQISADNIHADVGDMMWKEFVNKLNDVGKEKNISPTKRIDSDV